MSRRLVCTGWHRAPSAGLRLALTKGRSQSTTYSPISTSSASGSIDAARGREGCSSIDSYSRPLFRHRQPIANWWQSRSPRELDLTPLRARPHPPGVFTSASRTSVAQGYRPWLNLCGPQMDSPSVLSFEAGVTGMRKAIQRLNLAVRIEVSHG